MRGPVEIIAALGLPKVNGVLQVGASSGQEVPYFTANGISLGALIEPLDGPYAVLRQRCAGHEGFLPVQALCGSRDGDMVQFHVASNNGESSSILPPAKHLSDYPYVQFQTTQTIQTFTLDRIFGAVSAQRPDIGQAVNLLYMDVQGAELHVLKGANIVLHQVDYIYTEVGLGGGYEGDVELEDLVSYLKAYGFRLSDLEFNSEGWGNAMFIRRFANRWGGRAAAL